MQYWKYAFPLLLVLTFMTGCGGREAEKNIEAVPLMETEIAQVNDAFAPMREENGVSRVSEVSCFFTSYYDRAEDLDFSEFMQYFPATGQMEDDQEFAALAALPDFPWKDLSGGGQTALPVPVHKIPEDAVNAVLTE